MLEIIGVPWSLYNLFPLLYVFLSASCTYFQLSNSLRQLDLSSWGIYQKQKEKKLAFTKIKINYMLIALKEEVQFFLFFFLWELWKVTRIWKMKNIQKVISPVEFNGLAFKFSYHCMVEYIGRVIEKRWFL